MCKHRYLPNNLPKKMGQNYLEMLGIDCRQELFKESYRKSIKRIHPNSDLKCLLDYGVHFR